MFAWGLIAPKASFGEGIQIALLVFGVGSLVIYDSIREQIRVRDILDGRFFKCKSVVSLITKEQNIAEMANAFRHLLEAMKNWGGREIIELEPYKEPVLRLIEPPQPEATGGEVRKGLTPVWIGSFVGITAIVGIGGYLGCRNPRSYTRYSFPGFWSLIGMKKSMPLLTQRSGYILFFPFLKIAMRRVG